MIIGVDVGYTYTKFCTADSQGRFRSTAQDGQIEINQSSLVVEYKGKTFTIGEKGAYSVDLNKIEDETFRLCLYAAVVQSMKYNIEEINLVTGLPIDYFSKQKSTLKNSLENQDIFIKYQGENKVFTISKCIVFPQSAGLIALYPEEFKGDSLIVDIGGMTVDVSYFEDMKLVKYRTYPLGMLKLYGKIIQKVNAEYSVGYDVIDAEKIIREGLYIDDKKVNITFDEYLKSHIEEILRPIKLEFPFRTAKKIYIGGGALLLKDFIPGNPIIKEEDVYANARAFYQIGVEKYGS